MIKIITKRLLIREHKIDDLENYHKWISDPDIMRYVIGFPRTKSIKESFISLAEAIQGSLEVPRKKYYIALTLKNTKEYIGSGGGFIERQEKIGGIISIGYFLLKKYWHYGYATEATKAWIDYCFKNMNIHKIVASCDVDNKSSERIMIKCKMKKESELRKHRYQNGNWRDELQYAILKKDWELIKDKYCCE